MNWSDPTLPHVRELLAMIQDRCTMQEVAEHFGFSRQRVHQIAKLHGVEVPRKNTKAGMLTTKELCEAAGVSERWLLKSEFASRADPGSVRRGRCRLFPASLVDEILALRTCKTCGENLPKRKKIYCSPDCALKQRDRSEYRRRNHVQIASSKEWIRLYRSKWPRRRDVSSAPSEWMRHRECVAYGLSAGRLQYLADHGLMRTRIATELRYHHGRAKLYCRDDVDLAMECIAATDE